MYQKVIVSGEMRSGTTFVSNFLNSQNDAVCYSDFIRRPLITAIKLGLKNFDSTLGQKHKNIIYSEFRAECDLFNVPLYNQFTREDFNSINEFYLLAFKALNRYSESENKLVGIKMTSYQEYIFKFLDSGFKIIYLIRDPRDVLISSQNRFANFNIFSFLQNWKKSYSFLNNYFNNRSLLVIKYEDFISRKPEVIKSISEFCNISLDTSLSSLKLRDGIDYKENSSFGDINKTFDTSGINRWKREINKDVLIANEYLKKELKQLNYEIIHTKPLSLDYIKFKILLMLRKVKVFRLIASIVK